MVNIELATYQQRVEYVFKADSSTFVDIFGAISDTLLINFKTRSSLEFGKVTLKITLNIKRLELRKKKKEP